MAQESSTTAKKVWDSINLYAARCIVCYKWRIIPTKEKYEEIREKIIEKPFLCDTALEWRANVSCEDESDINQDNNLIWAMDKPNIPPTPPGWQRIIRLRAEGGTKFADVYYVSPSNKRFRSMTELDVYLKTQQEKSVSISQFSFQAPVALDENYAAKHRSVSEFSTLVPVEVNYVVSPENLEENVDAQGVGPAVAAAEAGASEAEVNVPTTSDRR
ncbi:hypothetical protein CDL12_24189 [Handroanthus impetiginosus]|uniref:Methyl-CpG binding transcription regulator n=1 Tax=Handroanthus impetiginosus TaxID=429701 RepID=A0A2G9GDB6_9LAMI|nr:hypothetical protein CDL12_24189 [Handroanthus impetiginosus]